MQTRSPDGHEGKGGQVGKDGQEPEEGNPEEGEPEEGKRDKSKFEQDNARLEATVESYALSRAEIQAQLKTRIKMSYAPAFQGTAASRNRSTLGLSDQVKE